MLIHELERQGNWLFRRRSFLPLLLLPFAVLNMLTHDHYLANSPEVNFWYSLACLWISLLGLTIRILTQGYAQAGSSGRNTRDQIAENLNTTGMYSVCRHPLYLGNLIMALGVLLFTADAWFVVSGILAYFIFYERIIVAEEAFIAPKFGGIFQDWAAKTPAWIPRLSLWQQPTLKFSWRAALKGEFYGLTATIASLFALDTAQVWAVEGIFRPFRFWPVVFAVSLLLFVVLRHLRKHTRFFEEAGRREF